MDSGDPKITIAHRVNLNSISIVKFKIKHYSLQCIGNTLIIGNRPIISRFDTALFQLGVYAW